MSKGDTRRPMQISPEEFDHRWAETFGVTDVAVIRSYINRAVAAAAEQEQDPVKRAKLWAWAQQLPQQWPT